MRLKIWKYIKAKKKQTPAKTAALKTNSLTFDNKKIQNF